MALPPLTPEERAAALEKAARARKERAEVKNRLKRGSTTLSDVIKDGSSDDVIGKMKVSALLESLPGVGKVRAKQIMERLGIANRVAYAGWAPTSDPHLSKSSVPISEPRDRREQHPGRVAVATSVHSRLTVLSGPSGVGKSTVVAELRQDLPRDLDFGVGDHPPAAAR